MSSMSRFPFLLVSLLLIAGAAEASPSLGASAPVENLKLEIGSLELRVSSGTATTVVDGERVLGIFLDGSGTYRYYSNERIELPAMEYLAKHATDLRPESGDGHVAVRDSFSRAFVRLAGRPLPEFSGSAAAPAKAWSEHRALFDRSLARRIDDVFLVQALEAPAATVAYAEIDGAKQDVVFTYDPIVARAQTLAALHVYSKKFRTYAEYLWPVVVSDQPIDRDRRDPLPPRLVVTHIDYTLTAGEKDFARIVAKETIVPVVPQRVALFELVSFYFHEAHTDIRPLEVKRVTDAAGNELPFQHGGDRLAVILPSPRPAGKAFDLTFELEGPILIRPNNSTFWQLSLESWLPMPEWAGRRFTVRSTVRSPAPYVPFAPGVTLSRREEDGIHLVENELSTPSVGVVVHAGNYSIEEKERDGLTVRVATYAGKNAQAVRQLTDLTFAAVAFYEQFLGPFPYREFNILQVDTWGYGQAPPGTMFITHEAFSPLSDELSQIYSEGVNERFLHEIAHQYWGNRVSFPNEDEQWLAESFSEYCAALFLREFKGKATYQRLVNGWRYDAKRASAAAPMALGNRIYFPEDPRGSFLTRTGLIYDKGSLLLAEIHEALGDQLFLTFLKSYQTNFAGKTGTTRHVEGLLEAITKKDWTPFFDKYYWGTAMP